MHCWPLKRHVASARVRYEAGSRVAEVAFDRIAGLPGRRIVLGRQAVALGLVLAPLILGCAPSPGPVKSASPTPTSPASARVPSPSGTADAASPTSPASGPTSPAVSSCSTLAAQLTPAAKVGQLYMVGLTQPGMSDATAAQLSRTLVGSVILMGNQSLGVAGTRALVDQLTAVSPQAFLLVAADQEGGRVQRLTGSGFSAIPSATVQAQQDPAMLTQSWATWGAELTEAGVRYDLAPVADVVPASLVTVNQPIGQLGRGYGNTAEQVAVGTSAVIHGLQQAGVASSAKHFPGIGAVSVNTDFGVAHDGVTGGSEQDLASFAAAIRAGASSVMVSSVVYDRIDPTQPAVFSKTIVTGMLRGQLGFQGVVISDDLGAAAAVSDYPVAQRGTSFLAAGGDIVLDVDPASLDAMMADSLAAVMSDPAFAADVDAKVTRVLTLKAELGFLDCG